MSGGLRWQGTHWICARCSNPVRLWANIHRRNSTQRFPSSINNARPNSTLVTPPAEGNSTSSKKVLDAGGERTRGPVPIRRKLDIRDIFVDDLGATLEAHRVANMAKLIRRISHDIDETITGHTSLQVPRIGTGQSAGPKQRVNESKRLTQISNHTDSIQKSDPPASISEDRLAEAEVPGRSTSTSTEAGRAVFAIRPGGDWCCAWKNTSSDKYGAIQQPWRDFVLVKEIDPMLRLDEEIRAFERYMTPDSEEETSVQKVIAQMKKIVASVAPSSQVIVHGSRYTKLASPLSDIDFVLSIPEYENNPLERGPTSARRQAMRAAKRLLWKIYRAVKPIAQAGSVEFIRARIPIVAAVDKVTGLSLHFSALAPYLPAREYAMLYLSEFSSLRPLYVLLHHFLLIRQMTTVYHGGLGSYPLLIMIVTALKHAGTTFGDNELARQLLYVLDFWSHADLRSYGYSADPPRVFKMFVDNEKLSPQERAQRSTDPVLKGIDFLRKPRDNPSPMCLQDPATPTNNLGKAASEIEQVQAVFSYAYRELAKSIRRFENITRTKPNIAGTYTFLDPLVRARYDDFEIKRKAVREASKITRVFHQLDITPTEADQPQSQEAALTSTVEDESSSSQHVRTSNSFRPSSGAEAGYRRLSIAELGHGD